jgi:serine O-acetyltransferase
LGHGNVVAQHEKVKALIAKLIIVEPDKIILHEGATVGEGGLFGEAQAFGFEDKHLADGAGGVAEQGLLVVGETTEIGDDVLLYQGVVLGGVSLKKEKRHPTIGNNVMIGAGTIILGPITIGDGAKVGAASLVVRNVPANSVAVGVPARVGVGYSAKELTDFGLNRLPDPIADAFKFISKQIDTIEERLGDVEQMQGIKVEIDRYVEDKKREIKAIFSLTEEFDTGAGI